MRISDVIRSLVDIVDNNSSESPATAGESENTTFTGSLKPVVLPDVKSQNRVDKGEKTASGNDEQPEELYLPPLQMKMELLKKAVDVENVYDDGTPEQQEEARQEKDGAWEGADHAYEYVGAQTGVVESHAEETVSESMRNILNMLSEESTEEKDEHAEKAGKKVAKDIEYDEGHKGKDDDKAEKAGKKVTKDIEYDDKKDDKEKCDESIRGLMDRLTAIYEGCDDEQLDELSKDTLQSYKDKAEKSRDKSWDLATSAAQRSNKGRKSDMDQFMRHAEQMGKRDTGIDRALDRLTKESDEWTVPDERRKEWRKGGGWDDLDDDSLDVLIRGQKRPGANDANSNWDWDDEQLGEFADAGSGCDWQLDEADMALARIKELAVANKGINPVVLDELTDDLPE